ncbi:hypothetical protein V8C86DRAFT_3146642 [Haematococcus lacustris]
MATDWGRFVNSANAQAPSPATLTGPANVTELTYHLLNRGYFPHEEINPRSTLYVIQQTAALKRVATHTHLVLRQSTQKEAMDVWIALVGTNGPKLYDVAMLVGWHNAPLEEVLKLNGASSGIMLNNVKASAVHGDMLQNSSSPTTNVPMDVPSIPAGSRHPYRPASTRDDDDGMQVEPYLQSPSWRRRLCDLDEDLEDDLGMQTATKPKPYVGHVDNNVHRHQPTREDVPSPLSRARPYHRAASNKDTLEDLEMQDEPALPSSAGRSRLTRSNVNIGDNRAKQDHAHLLSGARRRLLSNLNDSTQKELDAQDEPVFPTRAGRHNLAKSNYNIEADHEVADIGEDQAGAEGSVLHGSEDGAAGRIVAVRD